MFEPLTDEAVASRSLKSAEVEKAIGRGMDVRFLAKLPGGQNTRLDAAIRSISTEAEVSWGDGGEQERRDLRLSASCSGVERRTGRFELLASVDTRCDIEEPLRVLLRCRASVPPFFSRRRQKAHLLNLRALRTSLRDVLGNPLAVLTRLTRRFPTVVAAAGAEARDLQEVRRWSGPRFTGVPGHEGGRLRNLILLLEKPQDLGLCFDGGKEGVGWGHPARSVLPSRTDPRPSPQAGSGTLTMADELVDVVPGLCLGQELVSGRSPPESVDFDSRFVCRTHPPAAECNAGRWLSSSSRIKLGIQGAFFESARCNGHRFGQIAPRLATLFAQALANEPVGLRWTLLPAGLDEARARLAQNGSLSARTGSCETTDLALAPVQQLGELTLRKAEVHELELGELGRVVESPFPQLGSFGRVQEVSGFARGPGEGVQPRRRQTVGDLLGRESAQAVRATWIEYPKQ